MTWQLFDTQLDGKPTQVLLDDRFVGAAPADALPNLASFAVWCQRDPGDMYWHPDESMALDALESDLIGLADRFGNGWVVYVRRLVTSGYREYYIYFGGDAELDKVLPSLQDAHPGYRIEFETTADPDWAQYTAWHKDAPFG